jgi:2,4-dienoyl-CoA reductase-like NADH-dependent reductase (Old Yellow Enzyme family)
VPATPDKRLERLLPVPRWPTADEARAMRWYSPVRLGPIEAAERTWVPAMVPWRATDDGFVTEKVLGWYRRFAEGQPGVIVVEATGIRDVPSGPLLRIGHDRYLPGLRQLVETVREASGGRTRLFIQCIDFLAIKRRPPREKFLRRFLAIDDSLRERLAMERAIAPAISAGPEDVVREALVALDDAALGRVLSPRDHESLTMGYRERVTDLHLPHVRDLPRTMPDLFAAAARRARQAGFDGVELHYAHAYTMASFLSALNTRDDGYGGPREHRVRLPLEVYQRVRGEVGRDYVVGVRYLGDDVVAGGNRVEDAAYFGVRFAEAGFDFLSISKGGKFEDAKQPKEGHAAYPYTGPSGHECMPTVKIDARGPFGRNVPLAATIRRAVREAGHDTPIVASGGIASPWQAEEILERGDADIVASARQSLADPDWFRKIRLGRGSEVRRCLFTNYCEALDQVHKEVTCQRWDREQLEDPGVPRTEDGKRRLVAPPWI